MNLLARSTLGFVALLAAIPALAQPPTAPVQPPAQEPDASTVMTTGQDRITITGMAPVPNVGTGAPYHSPDDLRAASDQARKEQDSAASDARQCQPLHSFPSYAGAAPPTLEVLLREESVAAMKVKNLAGKAAVATDAALEARSQAALGRVDMKKVEATELARQEAVKALQKSQDKYDEAMNATADGMDLLRRRPQDLTWDELDSRADQRRRFTTKDAEREFQGLELTNLKSVEFSDPKKGPFIRVSGSVRNTRKETARMPALFVAAMDARGHPMTTIKVEGDRGARIEPGKDAAFVYDVLPPPQNTNKMVVVFASKVSPPPRMSVTQFCSEVEREDREQPAFE